MTGLAWPRVLSWTVAVGLTLALMTQVRADTEVDGALWSWNEVPLIDLGEDPHPVGRLQVAATPGGDLVIAWRRQQGWTQGTWPWQGTRVTNIRALPDCAAVVTSQDHRTMLAIDHSGHVTIMVHPQPGSLLSAESVSEVRVASPANVTVANDGHLQHDDGVFPAPATDPATDLGLPVLNAGCLSFWDENSYVMTLAGSGGPTLKFVAPPLNQRGERRATFRDWDRSHVFSRSTRAIYALAAEGSRPSKSCVLLCWRTDGTVRRTVLARELQKIESRQLTVFRNGACLCRFKAPVSNGASGHRTHWIDAQGRPVEARGLGRETKASRLYVDLDSTESVALVWNRHSPMGAIRARVLSGAGKTVGSEFSTKHPWPTGAAAEGLFHRGHAVLVWADGKTIRGATLDLQ